MASTDTKKSTSTSTKKSSSTTKSSGTSSTKKSTSSSTTKKSTSSTSKSSTAKKSTSSTSKKKTSSLDSAEKELTNKVNDSITNTISSKTGLDSSEVSKVVKKVGKLPLGGKIAVALCFLVGLAGGYVGVRFVQRNDQFSLINGSEYSVDVNDTYNYEDIKANVICISYGKDVTDSVSVDTANTNLDLTTAGTYKITYVSSNVKYTKISLTQTVFVVEPEDSVLE